MTNRNICVVGCGFVGLVTGVYFAECEFRNYSSKAAEIFVTGVEYVPSSK